MQSNETEIEIDGKISKALIDSGAMISMMSNGYCDEHRYEIQPLDRLVPILAYVSTIISKSSKVCDQEFDLVQVRVR